MANPQKENGYTAIANEILEALAKIRINGEARQVLDTILRKTYGFQKKKDQISLSQFCLSTGLKKGTICRALIKLKKMNLIFITQKDNDKANIFVFNKDFDTWKALPKKITLPKKIMGVIQKDKASLPKKRHTKENNTKETITKEITKVSEQSSQVQEIMNIFYKTINPTLNWGNRTYRKSAEAIIQQFGPDQAKRIVEYAIKVQGQKYAPTITNPYQLTERLSALMIYAKKQKADLPTIAKIR